MLCTIFSTYAFMCFCYYLLLLLCSKFCFCSQPLMVCR